MVYKELYDEVDLSRVSPRSTLKVHEIIYITNLRPIINNWNCSFVSTHFSIIYTFFVIRRIAIFPLMLGFGLRPFLAQSEYSRRGPI